MIAIYSVSMPEVISEDTEAKAIPEIIDYTKLSIEERDSLLPAPTDDYTTEYDAYCHRMGYTTEKMKSIRYKMDVYDEFWAEYQYRKKFCRIEELGNMWRSREKGAR